MQSKQEESKMIVDSDNNKADSSDEEQEMKEELKEISTSRINISGSIPS